MTTKRIVLIFGFLLLGAAVFWAGLLAGERRGVAQAVRGIMSWQLPEFVREYKALEAGDTEKAESICGQRIWSQVEQHDREFPNSIMSVSFQKSMPEARRIITVVSNSDWKRMVVDLDPETRRYMEAVFHDAYFGLFSTNAQKQATNPQGRANGRQPFRSDTNRASAADASRRSP